MGLEGSRGAGVGVLRFLRVSAGFYSLEFINQCNCIVSTFSGPLQSQDRSFCEAGHTRSTLSLTPHAIEVMVVSTTRCSGDNVTGVVVVMVVVVVDVEVEVEVEAVAVAVAIGVELGVVVAVVVIDVVVVAAAAASAVVVVAVVG